jgi:hypothetical protein
MQLAFVIALLLSASRVVGQSAQAHRGLAFMVNGDWGGLPFWPYKSVAQSRVARALGQQVGNVGARFTLLLGDNFYAHGVNSIDDHRFNSTFENVFKSEHLQGARHFRVIAGNHDHRGNVTAQIAYSSRSSRWFFPSEYYDFEEATAGDNGNMTVHFVMIDTVILSRTHSADAERHWAWLTHKLASSSADFLIVAGHYPVWSSCSHGPTYELVRRLQPLLEAAQASIYLAGHDHCAEHIDVGSGVQYHIVGAGNGFRDSHRHRGSLPRGSLRWHHEDELMGLPNFFRGAFAQVVIDPSRGLVVQHVDSDGTVLYTADPIPPRQYQSNALVQSTVTV